MTTEKRRLAAVLAADAHGTTLHTLTSHHAAMRAAITRFQGRLVDSPGDNLLSEFTSVVDAVECAVLIQHTLAERNGALPGEQRPEVRIGVDLGDVRVDGERLHGDVMTIAARLPALAEPGGIAISGTAHDQVATKLRYRYEALGAHSIEKIQQPVLVYRVIDEDPARSAGRQDPARATPAARPIPGAHRPSIAVLPFREYDLHEDNSYFAADMRFPAYWDAELRAYEYLNEVLMAYPDWRTRLAADVGTSKGPANLTSPHKMLLAPLTAEVTEILDRAPDRQDRASEIINQHSGEGAIGYFLGMLMIDPARMPAANLLIRVARRIGEHISMCLKESSDAPGHRSCARRSCR